MAVYDDNLSSDVSLSRILDELIVSDEKPATIVSFLRKYESTFKDIVSRSLYIDRLYFSGYLKELDASEVSFFLSHLDDIDEEAAFKCVWQCMRSSIGNANKHALASFIKRHTREDGTTSLRHPYSGYGNSLLEAFDRRLEENGFCPGELLGAMDYSNLEAFIAKLPTSLFAPRILQYDIYESCPLLVKYALLNMSHSFPPREQCNFFKQLLVSSASPEEKLMAYSSAAECYREALGKKDAGAKFAFPALLENTSLLKDLKAAKTYPPIALKFLMNGEDVIADSIYYLLMSGKIHIVAEMAESDPVTLEANFPIKDFLDYVKTNTNIIESSKKKHGRR